MIFRLINSVFLEFPVFYMASSFEDDSFWTKEWQEEKVHSSDSAVLLALDQLDEDSDFEIFIFSDSVRLPECGQFDFDLDEYSKIFEGLLSTPNGELFYTEGGSIEVASKQVGLCIYTLNSQKVCIFIESVFNPS